MIETADIAVTQPRTTSPTGALRGMAWDHPRARRPLEAVTEVWRRKRGLTMTWDARPLKDFEDQALDDLATKYDLVLLDYPYTGTAAASGLIVPVNDWVSADYLADQAEHSVGPSHASYTWRGRQWALAIDAACQVSAVREDLWLAAALGMPPSTWNDVLDLAVERRRAPSRVAMPLNPNHAYCAFLSIGVSLAGTAFWPPGGTVQHEAGAEALAFLRRLADCLHAKSRTQDPIGISDSMADGGEILYVPLMFGYSCYARPGFRDRLLRFGNAPRGNGGAIGSVLGGVGLALSARSARRDDAADLARLIGSREVQSGLYADSGGQPGHAAAWDSPRVNRDAGNFFMSTRTTMNQAFMRPRVAGHRAFQPHAGELIHACIWSRNMRERECLAAYDDLVKALLPDWGLDDDG